MGKWGSATENVIETITEAAKGGLSSNKAVNPLSKGFGNFTGGIEGVGRVLNNEGFGKAIHNTFAKAAVEGTKYGDEGYKAVWNNKKIAGSFLGTAAVGRIATGGGVYKDGNGNTNLVGVPFV